MHLTPPQYLRQHGGRAGDPRCHLLNWPESACHSPTAPTDRLKLMDKAAWLDFTVRSSAAPTTKRLRVLPRRCWSRAQLRLDDPLAASERDYGERRARIDVSRAMILVAMGRQPAPTKRTSLNFQTGSLWVIINYWIYVNYAGWPSDTRARSAASPLLASKYGGVCRVLRAYTQPLSSQTSSTTGPPT
jgi:hypothetical protein